LGQNSDTTATPKEPSLRQASLEAFEGRYDDFELATQIDEHKIKEEALQKVLLESACD